MNAQLETPVTAAPECYCRKQMTGRCITCDASVCDDCDVKCTNCDKIYCPKCMGKCVIAKMALPFCGECAPPQGDL